MQKKLLNKVYHELEPIYDENSQILILGSFPSVKSRENHFYYGHPQNRFWRVLEHLFHTILIDIEDKKTFLYEHHIALWDVIESCEIQGSSDASITNVKINDIHKIIAESQIKTIYVNGKKAEELYNKYVYEQTNIPCILLPSTSPANASYTLEKLIKQWEVIMNS